jgi:hypothetical protein
LQLASSAANAAATSAATSAATTATSTAARAPASVTRKKLCCKHCGTDSGASPELFKAIAHVLCQKRDTGVTQFFASGSRILTPIDTAAG